MRSELSAVCDAGLRIRAKRVWNGIAVSSKATHTLQCEPAHLILGVYFKRNEYTCSHKDLYGNVYSSSLHTSLQLETEKNDQHMLRPLGEKLIGKRIFT